MYSFLTRRFIALYRGSAVLAAQVPVPVFLSSALTSAASSLTMLTSSSMPPLSGPYQTIGVSSFYIQQPSPPLELVVKVFYPSSTSPPPRPSHPYMTAAQASATAAFAGIPPFLFAHLPRIKIRATPSAPLPSTPTPTSTPSRFPLLLYSHGLGGIPETYTVQACDLASRGFVVMMPTHNDHSASISQLPDGRVVEYVKVRGGTEREVRSQGLVQRVQEMTFLINHITASPSPSLPFDAPHLRDLLSRVDTSQLAVIGHSFGAATAVATASYEQMTAEREGRQSRIKAVVSHDQWCLPVYDQLRDVHLSVPTLFTVSVGFRLWDGNFSVLKRLLQSFAPSHTSRMLMIRESKHSNFSDVGLWSPTLTKWTGNIGAIDHERCWTLLNDYNALWCGKALGWQLEPPISESLLDEHAKPEEVEWLH